jgi:hypothetical protein
VCAGRGSKKIEKVRPADALIIKAVESRRWEQYMVMMLLLNTTAAIIGSSKVSCARNVKL